MYTKAHGKSFEQREAKYIKEKIISFFFFLLSYMPPESHCTPSHGVKDEKHRLWMAISKNSGSVKSAVCSCNAEYLKFTVFLYSKVGPYSAFSEVKVPFFLLI